MGGSSIPKAEYDLMAIMCILLMAHIIDCAISMEIDSSQPGFQHSNDDRAQHQSNYSSCSSLNGEPEINLLLVENSLMFVLDGPSYNDSALVQMMDCCGTGHKPPMIAQPTVANMHHQASMS